MSAYVRYSSVIVRVYSSCFFKLNSEGGLHGIVCKLSYRDFASSSILSPSHNSGKSNADCNTRKESVPKKVASIRSRMVELHRLQAESLAKQIIIDETLQENATFCDDIEHSQQAGYVEQEKQEVDTEFIKRVGKSDRQRSDAYVAMTFGLARFDSMNTPGNRRAQHVHMNDEQFPSMQCNTANYAEVKKPAKTVFDSKPEKRCEDVNLFDEKYFGSLFSTEKNVSTNPVIGGGSNLFDEHYFGDQTQEGNVKMTFMENKKIKEKESLVKNKCNPIDEQYFVQNTHHEQILNILDNQVINDGLQTQFNKKHMPKLSIDQNRLDEEDMNFFDQQYFELGMNQSDASDMQLNVLRKVNSHFAETHSGNTNNHMNVQNIDKFGQGIKHSAEQSVHGFVQADCLRKYPHLFVDSSRVSADSSMRNVLHTVDDDTTVVERVTRRELKTSTRPIANIDDPQTAYDYAVKLRLKKHQKSKSIPAELQADAHVLPRESKWTGSVDSKGFRLLKGQVIDLQERTQDEVVSLLKDSVIYEDDTILAIDKPYGLASHGGPGIHHSIGKLLEPLAQKIDRSGRINMLHLVHRLDKETTGVMVLAKTLQAAEFLLAMFKKRQVIKHYWVITKGIPNPAEGVIDIPMMEGTVGNKYRMQLQPVKFDTELGMRRLSTSNTSEAVTNYRVLSSHESAALVECTPETGVKHQIRCHLAFGLNTPILGDHKYSHFSKIAPQRLHPEILNLLGIRQAKVRHLPMHLHAKALILPEWLNGRNLFISARLPKHFVQNMKWLKLKPPG